MSREDTLILGAGPAGIAAAFELARLGMPFTVIEKRHEPGGIARTLSSGDFHTDIGPHRFFSDDPTGYDLVRELLGDKCTTGIRQSRFYVGGKLYDFPAIRRGLLVAGPRQVCRFGAGYLIAQAKRRIRNKEPKDFQEYAVSRFGRPLAEFNVLNFTEKFWGIPCSRISPGWVEQRMDDISIASMLKKILLSSKSSSRNLAGTYLYPEDGIGVLFRSMMERALRGDGELHVDSFPVEVRHENGCITSVDVNVAGTISTYRPKRILSSVPMTELLTMIKPAPPAEVMEAAKGLRFRAHVSLFIKLDRESSFPDKWLYFPESHIPFARVMEPRNFSTKMSPKGKTSLLVEYFCFEGDGVWKADAKELFEKAIPWLERAGVARGEEVAGYEIIDREPYAYPVYDLEYEARRNTVKRYLDGLGGLLLISRGGDFKYNNMDTAIEAGFKAARAVAEAKEG